MLFYGLISNRTIRIRRPFRYNRVYQGIRYIKLRRLIRLVFGNNRRRIRTTLSILFNVNSIFPLRVLHEGTNMNIRRLRNNKRVMIRRFLRLDLFTKILLYRLGSTNASHFRATSLSNRRKIQSNVISLPRLLRGYNVLIH